MRDPNRPRPEGWDSQRMRMESLGYEFDEDGNTVEIGYGRDGREVVYDWNWVEGRGHPSSLTVVCSAPHRGKQCGQEIAQVWTTPDKRHFYRSKLVTARANRTARYQLLMKQREAGLIAELADENNNLLAQTHPVVAAALGMKPQTEQEVTDKLAAEIAQLTAETVQGVLEEEDRFIFRGARCVPLGCTRHGNIRVGAEWLADEADTTRRKVNVNVLEDLG